MPVLESMSKESVIHLLGILDGISENNLKGGGEGGGGGGHPEAA